MAYKDPEAKRVKQAEYRERNREKIREWQRQYRRDNPEERRESAARSRANNAERISTYGRGYAARKRAEMRGAIFALLGSECVRCGFSDKRALCVDHINGGGHKERQASTSTTAYYRRVLEVGAADYQILCANCNQIKRIEEREHSPGPPRNTPLSGRGCRRDPPA